MPACCAGFVQETSLHSPHDEILSLKLIIQINNISQQICPESPELTEVEAFLPVDAPVVAEPQLEEEMEVDGEAPPSGCEALEKDRAVRDLTFPAPVDGNAEGNIAESKNVEGHSVGSGEESMEELQRSASPELEPASVPQGPETHIGCPICQGSFPVTEIEVHAAYCDGEVSIVDERRPGVCFNQAVVSTASLKPRRKRTRRADVTDHDSNPAR